MKQSLPLFLWSLMQKTYPAVTLWCLIWVPVTTWWTMHFGYVLRLVMLWSVPHFVIVAVSLPVVSFIGCLVLQWYLLKLWRRKLENQN